MEKIVDKSSNDERSNAFEKDGGITSLIPICPVEYAFSDVA